jgi:hypothetical protein
MFGTLTLAPVIEKLIQHFDRNWNKTYFSPMKLRILKVIWKMSKIP